MTTKANDHSGNRIPLAGLFWNLYAMKHNLVQMKVKRWGEVAAMLVANQLMEVLKMKSSGITGPIANQLNEDS